MSHRYAQECHNVLCEFIVLCWVIVTPILSYRDTWALGCLPFRGCVNTLDSHCLWSSRKPEDSSTKSHEYWIGLGTVLRGWQGSVPSFLRPCQLIGQSTQRLDMHTFLLTSECMLLIYIPDVVLSMCSAAPGLWLVKVFSSYSCLLCSMSQSPYPWEHQQMSACSWGY